MVSIEYISTFIEVFYWDLLVPLAKLHDFYLESHSLFSLQSPEGNRRQQIQQVQAVPNCNAVEHFNMGLWVEMCVEVRRYEHLWAGMHWRENNRQRLGWRTREWKRKREREILLMFLLRNYYLKLKTASQTNACVCVCVCIHMHTNIHTHTHTHTHPKTDCEKITQLWITETIFKEERKVEEIKVIRHVKIY